MPRVNTVNGTDEATNGNEITFKKNVDYFEMAEGTFYTIDALIRKYRISRSTVYNKAREAGMELVKIASFPCFMDDGKVFAKKERVYDKKMPTHFKPMPTYGELVKMVEQMKGLILAIDTRTFGTSAETRTTLDKVNLVYQQCYRMEEWQNVFSTETSNTSNRLDILSGDVRELKATLNRILDHLTKENKDA